MFRLTWVAAVMIAAMFGTAPATALPLGAASETMIDQHDSGLVIPVISANRTRARQSTGRCTPRYRRVCKTITSSTCNKRLVKICYQRIHNLRECKRRHCRASIRRQCRRVRVGTVCDTFGQRHRRSPVRPRP